jgi:hypothetical protein
VGETVFDGTVKRLLEEAQPIYQKAFASLDTIMGIIAERQGKQFNMDATWEILNDFMNGEMELDECIRLLEGNKEDFFDRYRTLIDFEKGAGV